MKNKLSSKQRFYLHHQNIFGKYVENGEYEKLLRENLALLEKKVREGIEGEKTPLNTDFIKIN